MSEESLVVSELDRRKNHDTRGNEYWRARDLQELLGYSTWRNFASVLAKAIQACETLGVDASNQFVATGKMVPVGSGGMVEVEDFILSRYAAYLIAMNGDTKKPAIAVAQAYFAIQTIRQETFDSLPEAEKRIVLRERVKKSNAALHKAAKAAGVVRFDIFNASGYQGMYDSNVDDIKRMKGIDTKEDLLDCIGRVELAANDFRITQTEQKLRRDDVRGQEPASKAHFTVGRKVRETMIELSGTAPEDLPREENIKMVEQRRKKTIRAAVKKVGRLR